MQNLTTPAPIELGSIVYKARGPDDAGYDLPGTYAGHPDRLDYYHVGVVTSVNPLNITHCTSWSGGSGIKVDTVIGKWGYGGRIKLVSYDTAGGQTMTATVHAVSGGTVRMRVSPTKTAIANANVPINTVVEVLEQGAEWWKIEYAGKSGWMQSEFLRTETPPAEQSEMITVRRDMLLAIVNELNGMLRA
jgi:hypothetical protein